MQQQIPWFPTITTFVRRNNRNYHHRRERRPTKIVEETSPLFYTCDKKHKLPPGISHESKLLNADEKK